MSYARLASLVIASFIGGGVVWVVKSLPTDSPVKPNIDVSTSRAGDTSQLSDGSGLAQELENREDLAAELARTQVLLREARAALSEVTAELVERDAILEEKGLPEGVGLAAFSDPELVKKEWESQAVDDAWAGTTESELIASIAAALQDDELIAVGHDIDCRTNICRVHITHASIPTDRGEFMNLGSAVSEVRRSVVDSSQSVTMAITKHRSGFSGELATSDVYFFRTGSAGSIDFYETPRGVSAYWPRF